MVWNIFNINYLLIGGKRDVKLAEPKVVAT